MFAHHQHGSLVTSQLKIVVHGIEGLMLAQVGRFAPNVDNVSSIVPTRRRPRFCSVTRVLSGAIDGWLLVNLQASNNATH